jgi:hypothetical protein
MKAPTAPPPLPVPAARLRWTFDDLIAADGHRLSVWFSGAFRLGVGPSDRKLFFEAFPNAAPGPLPADAVTQFFSAALRSTAADLAARRSVAEATGSVEPWIDELSKRANELAFGVGLEVAPPFDAGIESPTLQAERLEQMRRTAADRRAADRAGQFARAAELMKQWESLRASVGSVTPGAMLDRVEPADRGAVLETMMMASAGGGAAADLWVVAGPSLVRVGQAVHDKPVVVPVPSSVGPLRSIRSINGSLWVGGRDGVMRIDPHDPERTMPYCVPGLASEHGFTSVVVADRRVWATHRDAGLVCWLEGRGERPERAWSSGELNGVPGFLVEGIDSGKPVFAVGSNLLAWDGDRWAAFPAAPGAAKIAALLTAGDHRIVVTEDGTVRQTDRSFTHAAADDRSVGRVTAATVLPWLSSHRLLLARPDGPMECVGLEDGLVTRYEGGHVGLRGPAASAGRVAAMSADRQRVLAWDPWDGRRPVVDLHLAAVTKHRVADLAFG